MKNGFRALSVALFLPTIQFGLLDSISTLNAQEVPAKLSKLENKEGATNFEALESAEDDGAQTTLPLPQHPSRKPEPAASSLPKESQAKRDERPKKPVSARRTTSLPVPGRPGRSLAPLGSDGNSEASEEESADGQLEAPVGILSFLPHQFRNGGLNFECIYTGETFTKAHGGITSTRPTNYRSNLDLVGTLDTEKMGWWDSGRFFVYGQNLSGRPLSASDVGDVQLFSNLDSTISATERPTFTTISEYWYEHFVLDNRLRIKVGKQDANIDFALTDLGGEFVHSSFGFPPMIPMPTFPSQALGIASFYKLTETVNLGVAIYDGVLPSGPSGVRWGFDTLGHNGSISLYQLEFKPQLGPNGELPTTIRTGYWYSTNKEAWVEFGDVDDPRTFRRNYGTYTSVDQMIWKEEFGGDNDQGLGVFFQYGWAPSNRNFLTEYWGGGFVYKGLLPSRDADMLGLGLASVHFSDHYRVAQGIDGTEVGPSETAVELFYKAFVGKSLSLQPDLQYIANPGGQYKDTFLPGLRFEAIF
jgi:porin